MGRADHVTSHHLGGWDNKRYFVVVLPEGDAILNSHGDKEVEGGSIEDRGKAVWGSRCIPPGCPKQ